MSILILSAADVEELVHQASPKQLMDLMRDVFQAISASAHQPDSPNPPVQSPHRTSIQAREHTTLFMPSRLSPHGTAIKIVSVPEGSSDSGLPATTIVMDEDTGGVKAIVNARTLTALRTAAGSLLATSLLHPREAVPSEKKTIVLFGAGQQISSHADLFLSYYGSDSISRCYIINRSSNKRFLDLVKSVSTRFPSTQVEGLLNSNLIQVKAAVTSAHIIVAATSSTKPLFPSSWVRAGTHINLIGSYKPSMKEIDSELVHRAQVILVDSKAACAKEAGELIEAGVVREGIDGSPTITDARVMEVGQLIVGGLSTIQLVEDPERDVTMFKSVGVGAQDVAIAAFAVQLAKERRIGTTLAFD